MPASRMAAWVLRVQKRGPDLVSSVLVVLIATECVRAALSLVHAQPAARVAPSAAAQSAPRHSSSVEVEAILAAHLFGVPELDNQQPGGPSAASAHLVLLGTLASEKPTHGMAIIGADGPSKVYRVGDDVEGASLQAVYLDRVVLNRRGRSETLALPRSILAANPEGTANPGNGMSFGDVMRIDTDDDEEASASQGFRVQPGRRASAFASTGLRAGDVVTAVNGSPVVTQDPQQGRATVSSLLASSRASVSILRHGKPLELSIEISP
jgi:general secretion pathway protein C